MNEDAVIVIDRKARQKSKSGLIVFLCLMLVAVLGIGSTFAYLTWTSNQTPNRMTSADLTADVLEPAFTNAAMKDNTGAVDGSTLATTTYSASDGVGVPKQATVMMPGSSFAKNPFVVNTSKLAGDNMKGYAGLKVQFQKWQKTAAGDDADNTNDKNWVNMTADEVDTLFKVYHTDFASAAENDDTTAAGFTYNNTAKTGWTQVVDAAITGKDAGADADAGYCNATGAMYFINNFALIPLGDTTNGDGLTAATETNSSDTWGYSANSTKSSTLPLFNHVTYVKSATRANMIALNNVLDPKKDASGNEITVAAGKTFTPGWRMVISGAIVQAWDPSANSGAGAALSTADKTLRTQLVSALDLSSGTTADPVSRDNETAKPKAATGMREGSTLGKWVITKGSGAGVQAGTGVAEPHSIGKSATDTTDIDH